MKLESNINLNINTKCSSIKKSFIIFILIIILFIIVVYQHYTEYGKDLFSLQQNRNEKSQKIKDKLNNNVNNSIELKEEKKKRSNYNC